MKLQTIIVDGFKSYPYRQELASLDPHFTAITGTNGSGKSNLFDALCFVMGISQIRKLRADDFRDLIYKNGNAGIHCASVTLQFSNTDSEKYPPGFPPNIFPQLTVTRQLLPGGNQKCYLNGRSIPSSRLQVFFQSVSLNVENPHFIVLQGMIHKCIQMRPEEILRWMEEAAGTKMFDSRKRVATHLMQSKKKKLEEMDEILAGIASRLEKFLKEEDKYRVLLQQQQKKEEEWRNQLGYRFWYENREIEIRELEKNRVHEQCISFREKLQTLSILLLKQQKEWKMECLKTGLKEEDMGGVEAVESCIAELEAEASKKRTEALHTFEKKICRLETEVSLLDQQNQKREEEIQKLSAALSESLFLPDSVSTFSSSSSDKNLPTARDVYTALQKEEKMLHEREEKLTSSLHLLQSGVLAGEKGTSLAEEIGELEGYQHKLGSALRILYTRREELRREVKIRDEKRLKSTEQSDQLQHALEDAKKKIQKTSNLYLTHTRGGTEEQLHVWRRRMDVVTKQWEACCKTIRRLHFTFPAAETWEEKDAKKFWGRLGKFLHVEESSNYTLALSRLCQTEARKVVVGEGGEPLVEKLLRNYDLTERTTFLLLERYGRRDRTSHMLPPAQKRIAVEKALARREKVAFATELLRVPILEVRPLVEDLLGRSLVCSSLSLAREVTLRAPFLRSVTLQGDMVEPSGILHGGSGSAQDQNQGILADFEAAASPLADVERLETERREIYHKIEDLKKRLQSASSLDEAVKEAEAHGDALESQWHELKEKLREEKTSWSQTQESLQDACAENSREVKKAKDELETTQTRLQQLRFQIQPQANNEKELRTKEIQIQDARREVQRRLKAVQERLRGQEGGGGTQEVEWEKELRRETQREALRHQRAEAQEAQKTWHLEAQEKKESLRRLKHERGEIERDEKEEKSHGEVRRHERALRASELEATQKILHQLREEEGQGGREEVVLEDFIARKRTKHETLMQRYPWLVAAAKVWENHDPSSNPCPAPPFTERHHLPSPLNLSFNLTPETDEVHSFQEVPTPPPPPPFPLTTAFTVGGNQTRIRRVVPTT